MAIGEAKNCQRVLVEALGVDAESSISHCMQQVMLRMQSQEGYGTQQYHGIAMA